MQGVPSVHPSTFLVDVYPTNWPGMYYPIDTRRWMQACVVSPSTCPFYHPRPSFVAWSFPVPLSIHCREETLRDGHVCRFEGVVLDVQLVAHMSCHGGARGAWQGMQAQHASNKEGKTRVEEEDVGVSAGPVHGTKKGKPTAIKRDILAKRKEKATEKICEQWDLALRMLVASRNVMHALKRTENTTRRTLRQATILHEMKAVQYVQSCYRWLDHVAENDALDDTEPIDCRWRGLWPFHTWIPSQAVVQQAQAVQQWYETVHVELVVEPSGCRCHLQPTNKKTAQLVIHCPRSPFLNIAGVEEMEWFQNWNGDVPVEKEQPTGGGARQKKRDSEKMVKTMIQREAQRLDTLVERPPKHHRPMEIPGIHFPREHETMVSDLISALLHFQIRAYKKDPYKAKKTRRLVLGLREVAKAVRLKKAKLVVLARNLEVFEEEDGLSNQVHVLVQEAKENGILLLIALTRASLGKILGGGKQMGAVAIVDFSGAEEKYRAVTRMAQGEGL